VSPRTKVKCRSLSRLNSKVNSPSMYLLLGDSVDWAAMLPMPRPAAATFQP